MSSISRANDSLDPLRFLTGIRDDIEAAGRGANMAGMDISIGSGSRAIDGRRIVFADEAAEQRSTA
jgi:hypothetical protein